MALTMDERVPSELIDAVMARQGKQVGKEIKFLCPVHADHHPSAGFNPEKAVWHCQVCKAGGGWVDLAKRLNIGPEEPARLIVHKASHGKIVATYDYENADGVVLYQAVRYEPKDFRQRRPDGKGGWIDNLKGVPRVLYRLPALVAAPTNVPVYIVEGEKDADRLGQLGLVTTTNVGGAGNWFDGYSVALEGRHVVILPDYDEPGRLHAEKVFTSLRDVAASIRVVHLPDLPAKGDVSDFLDAGGVKEALEALVDAVEAFVPTQRLKIKPRQTAYELMELVLPEPRWAVPGLLPEGVTILGGKPKQGKSWMALQMALGIALGTQALGRTVDPGDVLYLALEDTWRRLQERIRKQMSDEPAPTRLEIEISCERLTEGGITHIDEWCAGKPDARLVIVDTLAKIRPRMKGNGNAYEDDYAAISLLKEAIADKYRVAVLIIHHLRKMVADDPLDSISGTMGLSGAADGALVLKRERGKADAALYGTGRDFSDLEIALQWDVERCTWSILGDAADFRVSEERTLILKTIREAGEPLTPKEVAGRTGKNYEAIKALLWKMAQSNEVRSTGSGKYASSVYPVDPGYPVTPLTPFTQASGVGGSEKEPW